ncbi:MAG TPA: methyl-accepting chemotaxis protein [Burkholderiaceae bacterium]|nr:methyl-accepting chemotaxis protein [Burkholderiaceae bacterium]
MPTLRRSLGTLIASGLVAAALLAAASQWGELHGAAAVDRALAAKDVTADILPPPLYLIELRLVLSQAVEGSITSDRAQAEAARLEKEYGDRVAYWKAHPPYGLEAKLLGTQHEAGLRFIEAGHEVLAAATRGDTAVAAARLKEAHARYLAHRAGVDDTVKASTAFADDATAAFERARRETAIGRWAVFVFATMLLLGFGRWAWRNVWSAVGGEPTEAAEVANAVARGDLTVRVKVNPGDCSSVMAAMRRMCEHLSSLVGEVRASAGEIATGSGQIASGNSDLAQRTERHASGLQEAAASMQQLSSTVRASASTAQEASQLAGEASNAAERGGSVVGQVVATMNEISTSSRRIGDIISVIDSIAFQTNILALNAAVEAARAGEQGRGFAVVASEVRSLAQRSSAAAREIKELISASVGSVEAGSRLVDDAGSAMTDIVQRVRAVNELIVRISSTSIDQTAGIDVIGTAVSTLDEATQKNSALVEESAAASKALNEQATRLVNAVSSFRLGNAGAMQGAS